MAGKRLEKLAQQATAIAEAAGFGVWHTGGGCEAFGKSLKEVEDGDVYLDVQIAHEGGSDINADPSEPVWQIGVQFEDRDGLRTLLSDGGLTLDKAIEVARGYEARAEELWAENCSGVSAKP